MAELDKKKPEPTPKPETAKYLREFLRYLALGLSPTGAAEKVTGLSLRSANRWRVASATYAQQWAEALDEGTDRLEDKALEFSTVGIVEFENIKRVTAKDGTVTETRIVRRRVSERLLESALKARRPDKWREQRDVSPAGSGGMGSSEDARKRIAGKLDSIARRTNGGDAGTGTVVPIGRDDATGSGGT